jgi:uncharacterized protein YdeI (YjbR/CyaY-like superfamily)
MEISKTLYVTSAKAWRFWLEKNYQVESEVWLVYPNRASGKPRITYNAAVEEALCYGWIDSNVKNIDEHSSAQRFSPRKPESTYSQANIERLGRLAYLSKLKPDIQKAVKPVLKQTFVFPEDIIKAIRVNKIAWENYQNFSPSYQRIRVAFIASARKRPDEFQKRLRHFIEMTEKNKLFGFGGIEAYY